MPLLARQALHNAGVSPGSLECIQLRTNASRPTADEMEVDSISDEEDFVGLSFRTARQVPHGNLARVEKKVKGRKRREQLDVRVDKRAAAK